VTDAGRRPHATTLTFRYPDEPRARRVAAAIAVEVGAVDGDRSGVAVDRDGREVEVSVGADDLVALRAACNSWLRLVSVAEAAGDAV